MKVSIDFDGTLSTKKGQKIAQYHLQEGDDLYVTTARPEDGGFTWKEFVHDTNDDIFEITDELGIQRNKIRFTNFELKYPYLVDFDVHYDDDSIELDAINEYTKCKGINIKDM